ncbi:hypothetical protein GGI12_003350 [Dipsacomyces acuminosporus]|nr:hypothetical protein GGI12_003350 [Dipsacomyces acuminosporus]
MHEFDRLLKKAGFKQGEDQVVLVGDLVAKGPDSIGVIRRARELDAWCVRGNHDDWVIRWREFFEGPGKGLSHNELRALEKSRGLPYADFKLSKPHYQIARKLSQVDFAFISSFPTIMVLPPPYDDWLVVHGGLDPSKPLSKQDSHDVMNMRNIDSTGPISSHDKGLAWFELWSAKMKILNHSHQLVDSDQSTATHEDEINSNHTADTDSLDHVYFSRVVYGHDAGRALQMHSYTKGLDTRCVYGGKLTAFILPGEHIVSVNCPIYDAAAAKDSSSHKKHSHRRRGSNGNAGQHQHQHQNQHQNQRQDSANGNANARGGRNSKRRSNCNSNGLSKLSGGAADGGQKFQSQSYSGAIGRYLQPKSQAIQHQPVPAADSQDNKQPAQNVEAKSKADAKQPSRRSRNRNRASSVF